MSHFTASDGRRIAFSDVGKGAPILCLAGLTRDARDFGPLRPHLGDYRMVTMDYRGRGASEWAADPVAEYQLPIESRDALELLDHLDIEAATIVGTSRGGLIGMGLAAMTPDRITALVLNDIGPVLETVGIDFILTYLGQPVNFPDFETAADRLMETYGPTAPDLTLADWQAHAERLFHADHGRPVLSYDPKLRDAVIASLPDAPPDLWPIFEAITKPMLALRGANSNLLTAETLAGMAARKPGMLTAEIPNRGHCPILDEPETLAALLPFLDDHA